MTAWSSATTACEVPVAQGGDRGGQRVVGVILLRLARAEHPYSGRQRGRDVDDVLAGRDQLLCQQVAQAAGGLDGPTPLREHLGPLEELLALHACGPHLELAQGNFVVVDGDGRVGALVGIHADQHLHVVASPRPSDGVATAGTTDGDSALASFEPRRGRALAGGRFVAKPHPKMSRHFKSPPARCPRRYGPGSTASARSEPSGTSCPRGARPP